MNDVLTTTELARLLDMSSRHVQQLERDGVLTKDERGRWPLEAVTQYVKYLRATSRAGNAPLQAARVELLTAQRHRLEQLTDSRRASADESRWMHDFATGFAHHCFLTHQDIEREFGRRLVGVRIELPDGLRGRRIFREPALELEELAGEAARGELGALKDRVWNLSREALQRGVRLTNWERLNAWMRRANPSRARDDGGHERAAEG